MYFNVGWPQGQFIQQIPTAAQPIETYQQYPNGIYQTTYQQPTFETNTFYTGAVQVLTSPRPPSAPNQQVQLAPTRPNSNYSHAPSPSPVLQQPGQQPGSNQRQYQEYQQQQQVQQQSQQNFVPTASTPTGTENPGQNSRPGSVNNIGNPPTPNPNFGQQTQQNQQQSSQNQQQQNFTAINNFSPNSQGNFPNTSSGNAQPGYPPVNNGSPQLVSHNSSGYPGQEQYSGQEHQQQWQHGEQVIWEHHQHQQQIKMEHGHYEHQDQQNNYMQDVNNSPAKMDSMHSENKTFSQADKVNLNTRIKTMILNKQQENTKVEENKASEQGNTGHFLWYSHHHHLKKNTSSADGGTLQKLPDFDKNKLLQNVSKNKTDKQHFQHQKYNSQSSVKSTATDVLNKRVNSFYSSETHCQSPDDVNRDHVFVKVTPRKPTRSQELHGHFSKLHKAFGNEQKEYSQNLRKLESDIQNSIPIPQSPLNDVKKFDNRIQNAHICQQNTEFSRIHGMRGQKNHNLPSHEQANNLLNITSYSSRTIEGMYGMENRSSSNSQISDNLIQLKTPESPKTTHTFSEKVKCPETLPSSPIIKSNANVQFSQSKTQESHTSLCDQLPTTNKVPNSNLPQYRKHFQTPEKHIKTKNGPFSSTSSPTKRLPLKFKDNQFSPVKLGMEIPHCKCFPTSNAPPESGTYYTHLGCANNLKSLRYDLECRTGVIGRAIRFEKIKYTGREGKTAQGCPIAKWVSLYIAILLFSIRGIC